MKRWIWVLPFLLGSSALAQTTRTKVEPPPQQRAPAQAQFEEIEVEETVLDMGPEADAEKKDLRVRPPGPVQGGTIKVPHPRAAQGLLKINKDGSYLYRVPLRPKSQALSFRIGAMTPPNIKNRPAENTVVTYKGMYGDSNIMALMFDYEWDPFQKFGSLGIQLGGGFFTANGNGTLAGSSTKSMESFNLYVFPLSAFAIYRFEYVRRQWVVPFINGGGTYYGMMERRDDGEPLKYGGSPAVGGGGGFHFNISRLDPAGAFTLDREYGIADMWLTVEARVMQGLYQDFDMSNEMITAGITVDF